jgi:hypothetical protein
LLLSSLRPCDQGLPKRKFRQALAVARHVQEPSGKPRYQDINAAEIPEMIDDDGTRVRVICGDFWGTRGPVEGVAADPRYLDVWVQPGKRKTLAVETERHAFAYVFEGGGSFRSASAPFGVLTERAINGEEVVLREYAGDRSLVLFDRGRPRASCVRGRSSRAVSRVQASWAPDARLDRAERVVLGAPRSGDHPSSHSISRQKTAATSRAASGCGHQRPCLWRGFGRCASIAGRVSRAGAHLYGIFMGRGTPPPRI